MKKVNESIASMIGIGMVGYIVFYLIKLVDVKWTIPIYALNMLKGISDAMLLVGIVFIIAIFYVNQKG